MSTPQSQDRFLFWLRTRLIESKEVAEDVDNAYLEGLRDGLQEVWEYFYGEQL